MGRTPCSVIRGLERGSWRPEEDLRLRNYIEAHGEGGWTSVPMKAGLLRSGKSCRLRWLNYLRPDVKHGHILPDEEDLIIRLHRLLGNRWSLIAGRMPGRTDNEIKNYWNTRLRKKLISKGIDPCTHKPFVQSQSPDVMCSNPGDSEVSEKSQLEDNNNMPGNTVDSRADLRDVASKVTIEDGPATIPDPLTPFSDPCIIATTAAVGDFNSDIFPLLMESFADEELHLQEPFEHISMEQYVQLTWPSSRVESANFGDDLWSIPCLSSQYYRFV
eukprot:PITA_01279